MPNTLMPAGTNLAVVFDIDGTICNNDHRRHFVERPKGKKDWRSFFEAMDGDVPNAPVCAILNGAREQGLAIVLASGREEKYRERTEAWMARHLIRFDRMYMRPTGDYRPDTEIKLEMLAQIRADGFEPFYVVEDRASVVVMWRKAGLICFQCADGNF